MAKSWEEEGIHTHIHTYKASLAKVVLVTLETLVLGAVGALQSKHTRNTLVAQQLGFITLSKGERTSWETMGCFSRKVLERTYYRI